MTKKVRVENADTNTNVQVVVKVYDRGVNGAADTLVSSTILAHPADMTEACLTSSRYATVEEVALTTGGEQKA